VPDKAVISHRGEKYEIGRGRRFYGIWVVGAPYEAPVDRWPENRDGWNQAWSRFATLETPGTIAAVTRERKAKPESGGLRLRERLRPRSHAGTLLAGEALLVLGVVLGLIGLFPDYAGGQSLLGQASEIVPHLCYVIGWAVAAAFVALGVARPSNAARLGALFALGLSAVTLGMFVGDTGEVVAGKESLGSGLVISLAGWFAVTAGAALVLAAGRHPEQAADAGPSRPVRPGRAHFGPLALLVLAAIGTAAAFIPSWDSYTLTTTAEGSQTITAGNAFDNPGLVTAGNVLVIAAIIGVAVVAALWRPARQGAWLLAGAIVPLAAEVVSAMIQVSQGASPTMFGISAAEATELGLKISSGLTGIFWVYFVFVISLIVSCAWLSTEPDHPVMSGYPASPWLPAGGDQGTADPAETTEETDSESAAAPDSAAADSRGDVAADNRDADSVGADSRDQAGGGESAYA
jgi:hypothetical protein